MDKIIVEGGRTLSGEVQVSGAKNAALPILAASLLVDGWNTFYNVPELQDISTIGLLLEHLGAKVEKDGHTIKIDASGLCETEAPYDLVRRMRASVLVLGPLTARLKKARVSLPGGCAIGARPIDQHLRGLEMLGATVELSHGYVEVQAEKLRGADIYLDTPTVTGTENLMMAACLAEGVTILRNVAREPEIVALADLLNRMGGKVEGAGSPVLTITGVEALNPVEFTIIPDRIEAGTFMVAAALTEGDVLVKDAVPAHLQALISKLRLAGATVTEEGNGIRVQGKRPICSVDVKTLPHPGFPTDMQAQFMVLMTTAKGLSVIAETIFENRFIHVSELVRMGANISISQNSAVIRGVKHLSAAPVMATDLRASASLILAGLIAQGSTEIHRVYHIDRGYESIEQKFSQLGAAVRRVK
ncbi:UDP-N-acetylglucosamine 1-carboxyvinyltransferase [Desulfatibacillum aliphaticivorans]|uniref:UDP-N-acetylglucosamine 1-carboxyvinyltransferase n=1 Tax=Desulfatibacillum aliphaticivorans TaxID=218208 RepID=MURA_DESAL|nr:UDP-N-acetylglucosamine 1-carboxyvinyltransferase [Desulfatibacillum aliphaticivorans]B8FKV1.1 RecName: Full=UDP-N-acetylglucosamine 1-carboxyvinyltransferase; AltName: Full=Enoylpyruvate transferase; AltName: Full=UDP-N-acetylglucosamine enolpyruvyl transferase; Short=EPT [Desulfatibacillum aliphaticivorans]ACL04473.1 UDP-N-acetylglucosamine 1-carboxyvinyltransferase [Desulfatibacillum aliphaticivorans]